MAVRFSQFDDFSLLDNSRKFYVLDKPLVWDIGMKGSGWSLEVPAGIIFDISVPRCLEWILSPHDKRILLAALVHDVLLRRGHDAAFSSSEFRRAAIARGVNGSFAWMLFFATLIWAVLKSR